MTTAIDRLLICGGRVGINPTWGFKVLDAVAPLLAPKLLVIEGEALGWDRVGRSWARSRGHLVARYKIDPKLDGEDDKAPKRRNQRMLEFGRPGACLCFPGGPGTRDMMTRALDASIVVLDVDFNDKRDFKVWRCDVKPATLFTSGDLN